MLSEKEIEALKNGAYGITASGKQCRLLEVHSNNVVTVAVKIGSIWDYKVYSKFPYHQSKGTTVNDIVGLWENKPEPFNLERALSGEPLIDLHNNEKLWLYKSHKDGSLITEYENTYDHLENINPLEYLGNVKDLSQCFGMWKEPEIAKSNADNLPKPIREFGDLKEVWYVHKSPDGYMPYNSDKGPGWTACQCKSLGNNCYYATEEDCQAVCDWLMSR